MTCELTCQCKGPKAWVVHDDMQAAGIMFTVLAVALYYNVRD